MGLPCLNTKSSVYRNDRKPSVGVRLARNTASIWRPGRQGYAYNSAALLGGLTALGQTFNFSTTAVSDQTIQLFNGPTTSLLIIVWPDFHGRLQRWQQQQIHQSLSNWHYPQNYAGRVSPRPWRR